MSNVMRETGKGFLLFVAYVVTARLGLSLSAVSGFASFIWIPTGISFAALYLWGRHLTPAVFVGAAVANFLTGADSATATLIAIGNAFEAWLGVTLFLRFSGRDSRLDQVKDVANFVFFGALLSTLVSATIGTGALYSAGIVSTKTFGETWRAWYIGDGLSDLVIAPLIIVWSRLPQRIGRARMIEGVLLSFVVILVAFTTFGDLFAEDMHWFFRPYWMFLLFIWGTLRFGQHANVLMTFSLSVIAVTCTMLGHGPYNEPVMADNLLLLQLFSSAVALGGLFFGALGREKENALRLRTDFISIASHELRTPITSLNISIIALREQLRLHPDPRVNEIIAAVERQSLKLNALTESLLNVAQIESGNLVLEKKETDLSGLVQDVTRNLHDLFRRTSCELVTNIQPSVKGKCSAYGFEQILTNLMMNSLKYGLGKPVTITLTATQKNARLTVSDNGVGISPLEQQKVFDRYHRAHDTAPGMGLGLYITRLIVDAHQGKISVESEEGKGSTFTVEIPLTLG